MICTFEPPNPHHRGREHNDIFNSPQRRKGRKEDNALVTANFIEYFLCALCAFAVNKNSVIDRSKYNLPHLIYQRPLKHLFIKINILSGGYRMVEMFNAFIHDASNLKLLFFL